MPTTSTSNACLSGWRIGRLACGDAQADARTADHLETCARCSEALAAQRNDVAAARLEAVPAALKLPKRTSRAESLRGGAFGFAMLATAACAAWLVVPGTAPTTPMVTHIKGTAALVATIKRDDKIVAEDMALEKLQDLQTNDHMRLRVLAEQGRFIDLATSSNRQSWEPVYQGELGADKWLPVGLRLDTSTPTWFRLRLCTSADDLTHCDEHIYKL